MSDAFVAPATLINNLASSNPAPLLAAPTRNDTPRFAEHFSWIEQDRGVKALGILCQDSRVEVWEEMLNHITDQRYALTMFKDDPGHARNYTVGEFCGMIASHRLFRPLNRHIVTQEGRRPWLGPNISDLSKWRRERQEKKLFELQIEICEHALSALNDYKGDFWSVEDVKTMRRDIEREIDTLRKTSTPVFDIMRLRETLNIYPNPSE